MAFLYVRAEGSAQMGLGHLMRSFALAKMLSPLFPIRFVINEDAPESIRDQIKKDFDLFLVGDNDKFLMMLQKGDGVILDGYHYSTELQKKIKQHQVKLVCIDDMHDKHFYADLIINQALGITKQDYLAEDYTHFLFGPHYALLRESFLKKKLDVIAPIRRIFVCFGGSDHNNVTLSVLQLLEEFHRPLILNVVLGASYHYIDTIKKHAVVSKHIINIHQDVGADEMASLIFLSDLGVVPCSSTLLEVLSIGIPAIAGYYTDNQLDIYQTYLQNRLLTGIGDYNKISERKDFLFSVLEQKEFPSVSAANSYFDGKSPVRLRKEFVKLFFSAWGMLRKANMDDCELLFQWVNDPETRKNAVHQDSIPWADHQKWFHQKLADENCYLFISEFNGNPVGQIRFDLKESGWDVTYAVAPGIRGVGLGRLIVEAGIDAITSFERNNNLFRAIVRKENMASSSIFRKLGFIECGDVQIGRTSFLQYKLQVRK